MHLIFQKEFVRLIQGSGILVVLSPAWIEELYYQVLERNLLGEAGYWGSPEDQALPLIATLTGNRRVAVKTPGYPLAPAGRQVGPARPDLPSPVRHRRAGQQRDWRSADQQGSQPIASLLRQEQQ